MLINFYFLQIFLLETKSKQQKTVLFQNASNFAFVTILKAKQPS